MVIFLLKKKSKKSFIYWHRVVAFASRRLRRLIAKQDLHVAERVELSIADLRRDDKGRRGAVAAGHRMDEMAVLGDLALHPIGVVLAGAACLLRKVIPCVKPPVCCENLCDQPLFTD